MPESIYTMIDVVYYVISRYKIGVAEEEGDKKLRQAIRILKADGRVQEHAHGKAGR